MFVTRGMFCSVVFLHALSDYPLRAMNTVSVVATSVMPSKEYPPAVSGDVYTLCAAHQNLTSTL